jgi:hypothetical protein
MENKMRKAYKKPKIRSYGNLKSITKATGNTGANDGKTYAYNSF